MATRRILCASVLGAEAFIVWFALLAASGVSGLPGVTLLWLGGGTALACLVLAASLPRRWAYAGGSLLQVLLVAAGFVVPAMFFIGALFAALWITALVLAQRVEALRRAPRA